MTSRAKDRGKAHPGQRAGRREERGVKERPREATGATREDDPREEEGWTQPESSAQKGAIPDEG